MDFNNLTEDAYIEPQMMNEQKSSEAEAITFQIVFYSAFAFTLFLFWYVFKYEPAMEARKYRAWKLK